MDLRFNRIGAELGVAGDQRLAPRLMDDGVKVVLRLYLDNGGGVEGDHVTEIRVREGRLVGVR